MRGGFGVPPKLLNLLVWSGSKVTVKTLALEKIRNLSLGA